MSLAFSPDSRTLASASLDKSAMLWDLSNPKEPERLGEPLRHNDMVISVIFSPDGKMLASASCDRRIGDETCPLSEISVWDVSDPVAALPLGQPLTTHRYFIVSLTFSPDGRVLASSGSDGSDGSIILWDIDPRSWVERACRKAGRNFTSSEWERYFPDEEYHATCERWPFPPA
jgi:WD40 repeat protein